MLNPVLPFKSSARHRLMILERTFLLEVDLGWEDRRDIFLCQVRRRRRTKGYGIGGIDRAWDSCCSACLVTFVRSIGGKKDIVRTQIHPLSASLEKYGLDQGGRVERDQPTVS